MFLFEMNTIWLKKYYKLWDKNLEFEDDFEK